MAASDLTRYFLHLRDGTFIEDPDGSELPSLQAAREFALQSARELWSQAMTKERDLSDAAFEISDAAGELLAVVPLTDALPQGLRERLKA